MKPSQYRGEPNGYRANAVKPVCGCVSVVGVSEDRLYRNISRMCKGRLSRDDVDRCGHREEQDNMQAASTAQE